MRFSWLTQLGFDFGAPATVETAPVATESRSPSVAPLPTPSAVQTPASLPAPSVALASVALPVVAASTPPSVSALPGLWAEPAQAPPSAPSAKDKDKPSRGRSATRARTAVLFTRLQELGLRGVDALVLMRTRTVMVSLIGRTLRVHEGYADAPEPVLRAIITFAMARTKAARSVAREAILQFEIDRAPAPRRIEPPRAGDLALIAQLAEAHRQLNAQHFDGALTSLPIRLSGRMATRLGHFDPGSKHVASEIVMSRKHVVKHGWREAMHTLLHEMVHQWQHETGVEVDHGPGFRAKCREVGITPAARRHVTPIAKRMEPAGRRRA